MNSSRWSRLRRRVDALSVRERVIMAGSLAAAMAALVDFAVLTPQFKAQQEQMQRLSKQAKELSTLRTQLLAPVVDTPYSRLAETVKQRQAELAALDARIGKHLAGSTPAAQLPDLLRQALARHEQLTLLKLDTVPPAANDPVARRAVDLHLAGRYADLAAYAATIERQLPGLRWTSLRIDTRGASGEGTSSGASSNNSSSNGPLPAPASATGAQMSMRVWLPGVGS